MPDRYAYGSYSLGDDWPGTPPPSRSLPAGLAAAADQLRRVQDEATAEERRIQQETDAQLAAEQAAVVKVQEQCARLVKELIPLIRRKPCDGSAEVTLARENPRWWQFPTETHRISYWVETRRTADHIGSYLTVFENGDWHFYYDLSYFSNSSTLDNEIINNYRFSFGVNSCKKQPVAGNLPFWPAYLLTQKLTSKGTLEDAYSEFRFVLATLMQRLGIA